jgi:hypothetical protein
MLKSCMTGHITCSLLAHIACTPVIVIWRDPHPHPPTPQLD